MKTFSELEEAYAIAYNALNDYRHASGFVPGVRVVCKFRDDPEKGGVIAPHGSLWTTSPLNVPVVLDEGRVQPWSMGDLRLAE